MTPTAAEVVERASELWPETAAALATPVGTGSKTLGEAWAPQALRIAGPSYDPDRLDAAAHALAHSMYRSPSTDVGAGGGSGGAGAVTSISTKSLKASFGSSSTGSMWTDAVLELTLPGQALLMLRATCLDIMPLMIC